MEKRRGTGWSIYNCWGGNVVEGPERPGPLCVSPHVHPDSSGTLMNSSRSCVWMTGLSQVSFILSADSLLQQKISPDFKYFNLLTMRKWRGAIRATPGRKDANLWMTRDRIWSERTIRVSLLLGLDKSSLCNHWTDGGSLFQKVYVLLSFIVAVNVYTHVCFPPR